VDPQQIRAVLRRGIVILVVLVGIGAGAGYLAARSVHPTYKSVGTIQVVSPSQPSATLSLNSGQIIDTAAALIVQPSELDKVARELNLPPGVNLGSEVTAIPEKDTTLVDVTVTDGDPNRAASITNTLMKDFVADVSDQNWKDAQTAGGALQSLLGDLQNQVTRDQQQLDSGRAANQDTTSIERQLAADRSELVDVTNQYNTFIANQAQNFESMRVITPAVANGTPVAPNKVLLVSLGAFGGLLVALALTVLLTYLDQGLRNEADVRLKLGLPTLGVVPRYNPRSRRRRNRKATDMASEAYRRLRTNLLFSTLDKPVSTVLVTSTRVGEGKTRTAANLAGVIAAAGQRTLLIDADMRRAAQHGFFPRTPAPGLSDLLLLSGREEVERLDQRYRTDHINLWLLPSGTRPPNPSELVASRHTAPLLRSLERQFEITVVDSPPVELVTDSLSLAASASATVLVIEAGRTNARDARQAVERLRSVGANVIGVVLNKTRRRDMAAYQYAYYYAYVPVKNGSDAPVAPQEGDVASWQPLSEAAGSRR
jgi:capsular exopolysaccharide synthesis family protein